MVVQWLGLRVSTAGSLGLIPGQGTKIRSHKPPSTAKKTKNKNKTQQKCIFSQFWRLKL